MNEPWPTSEGSGSACGLGFIPRVRMGWAVLLMSALAGTGAWSSRAAVAVPSEPSIEELRLLIPAEIRPDRRAVPDEDNAALLLVALMRHGSIPEPDVREALRTLGSWKEPDPSDSEVAMVGSWLLKNGESMRQIRSAARRNSCLFPAPSVTNPADGLGVLMPVLDGLLCDARLHWKEGARSEAIAELGDALTVGQRVMQGSRTLIHYLISASIQRRTLDAIAAAALSPTGNKAELQRMAGLLSAPPDPTALFRACLRSELSDFILPATRLEVICSNYSGFRTNTLIMAIYPEEIHRPLQLVLDPKLLAIHPRPFDSAGAMRAQVAHWTSVDQRVNAPWSTNAPPDLSEAVRARFVADVEPVEEELDGEELPLSDEAVARAAPLFVKVENPVGRLMASLPSMSERLPVRAIEAGTRWRAVATVVAVRRWALDHGGALPDSLESLVDGGLLPGLPRDAFSGKPLNYSRRRGLVWSVGENARDDDGKLDPGFDGTHDDLSWPVIPGTQR